MSDAVIVDVDGTLAEFDPEAVREWVLTAVKDWDAFFRHMADAEVIPEIHRVVLALKRAGYRILVCSGRPEAHREATVAWLEKHQIPYDGVYLRAPEDDEVADEDVKEKLLARIREHGHNPWLVIDDRKAVVDRWREMGLCCLQCAPGEF
ncbi:phosphatase domain-containing protein [Aestuariispira ectoiniformans]|uniref:phosphatase domain-containing protein n=1 Tax=Aestuariispira ectoiniformans TaxID=2775080 RepID=UPI00223B35C4|nr:HAD family acid phosphatase [Aestuariispira ectoiniformans]